MRESDSRLPRRDGDLLSLLLVRRYCGRRLCLRQWMFLQCEDVRTDFGGNIARRWPRGPFLLAGA
eukprot:3874790-Pyramimonas_sp.AAC.1